LLPNNHAVTQDRIDFYNSNSNVGERLLNPLNVGNIQEQWRINTDGSVYAFVLYVPALLSTIQVRSLPDEA
jgi:hypothetical protein